MNVDRLDNSIDGLILFTPRVHRDSRGSFFESYSKPVYEKEGVPEIIQWNVSCSHENVLRGLHYQLPPHEQGKLVQVLEGRARDVIVDIRPYSKTFKSHSIIALDGLSKKHLWIPPGCAHGFLALSDEVVFMYGASASYMPGSDRGIMWNDPELDIDWRASNPILSEKDAKNKAFSEAMEEIMLSTGLR